MTERRSYEPHEGLLRDVDAVIDGLPEYVEDDGTVRMSDVVPIKIEWLWDGRVPFAMLTVVTGPPKVGKSTILYDRAARASRDGQHVLIATAEDHLAAVVRPRLEAASANLDLIHAVTDPITLPEDAGRIEEWIRRYDAKMVVIDPLVAFISESVNTHRDHHVRRVLAPLAAIAESTSAAILVVIHTNKDNSGSDPLTRVSGSIGFAGAGRSIVVAAKDPQDDSRCIFGVAGTNLAEAPPVLAYRVVGHEFADGIRTGKIQWLGEAPEVEISEVLAQRDPEERSQRAEAIEFLRTSGAMDSPQPVKDLQEEAEARGISSKTLQRARRALRLPVTLPSFGGPRYWGPSPDTQSGQPPHPVLTVQTVHTVSDQPHPVQTVHTELDQQEQGSSPPSLDIVLGPEEVAALERAKNVLGAEEIGEP